MQVASRSRTAPPFTTTPRLAATDRPDTSATGAARINGHGVATTRSATARAGPAAAHARLAATSVSSRNHSAYRSARRTKRGCADSASATRRTIPAYVLSAALAEADRSKGPPALTTPLRT